MGLVQFWVVHFWVFLGSGMNLCTCEDLSPQAMAVAGVEA